MAVMLTTQPDVYMAASEAITIPFELPVDEAAAFAQFVKRFGYDTCTRFASKFVFYAGLQTANVAVLIVFARDLPGNGARYPRAVESSICDEGV